MKFLFLSQLVLSEKLAKLLIDEKTTKKFSLKLGDEEVWERFKEISSKIKKVIKSVCFCS